MTTERTPQLITHISKDLKYLLHWENGLQLADARGIADHLNLLELSFYHTGLSENINEGQHRFLELIENAPAANLIKYVIGTGRNRYEHKIEHDWQRPMLHHKTTPAHIFKPLLEHNPYSEDTLIDRLRMTGKHAHIQKKHIQELARPYVPGAEAHIKLPQSKNFRKYRESYNRQDYPAVISSLANNISKKLASYPAPVLSDAQMNNKIATHRRESEHQLPLDDKPKAQRHPGISHFYTPSEPRKEEEKHDAPAVQYLLDL